VWQELLGEFKELTACGIPPTGTQNIGGSMVTAGGLVFIGSTQDEMFRAFDKTSGKPLGEVQLPAGGYATPCTYEAGGKQSVVIAAGGGGKMATNSGDACVAFTLPRAIPGTDAIRRELRVPGRPNGRDSVAERKGGFIDHLCP
jgi:quinoprotein glucose dehydrogenase